MSDHSHYDYAYSSHDHDYAESGHDHDLDYAEKHHRHYDDEAEIRRLRGGLDRALQLIAELEDRIRQLEEPTRSDVARTP